MMMMMMKFKPKHLRLALIGMPGCGKSTIGRLLAQRLSAVLIDQDELLSQRTGKSINELFQQGEESFRDLETTVLLELAGTDLTNNGNGKISMILSTGGGIVKAAANRAALKQNFTVIYIDRSLERILSTLDSDSRPLLKNNTANLSRLYEERAPLYQECCDFRIDNNGEDPTEAVAQIIEKLRIQCRCE